MGGAMLTMSFDLRRACHRPLNMGMPHDESAWQIGLMPSYFDAVFTPPPRIQNGALRGHARRADDTARVYAATCRRRLRLAYTAATCLDTHGKAAPTIALAAATIRQAADDARCRAMAVIAAFTPAFTVNTYRVSVEYSQRISRSRACAARHWPHALARDIRRRHADSRCRLHDSSMR